MLRAWWTLWTKEGTLNRGGAAVARSGGFVHQRNYHRQAGNTAQGLQRGLTPHLVQKDGSSGTVTITVSGSAGASGTVSAPQEQQVTDYVDAYIAPVTVAPDSRAVTISSSLGLTHHRDPNTGASVDNVPDENGTLNDDTVAPDAASLSPLTLGSLLSVAYSGHYGGYWNPQSDYTWSSSLTNDGYDGSFFPSPDDIGDFGCDYYNTPAAPNATEAVSLKCKDSNDGAEADAYYFLHFHDKYENWVRDNSLTVTYPRAYAQHPEDWTSLKTVDNSGSPNPVEISLKDENELSKTMDGTIGAEVSGPKEIEAFNIHEEIKVGEEAKHTWTDEDKYTVGAGQRVIFYAAMTYEYRAGTCSLWGHDGYDGNQTWHGIYASGVASIAPVLVP